MENFSSTNSFATSESPVDESCRNESNETLQNEAYRQKNKEESATRYEKTSSAIKRDFAEHLKYDEDADEYHRTEQARYKSLALSIRDRILHQWNISRKAQRANGVKRVYYLSLEFLMGRALTNNINNMGLMNEVKEALSDLGYNYEDLEEIEPDAGLGNGGLGRLAACFLDSMATLDIPSYGYGIRYNYGIFKQLIKNGYQFEQPDNWLRYGNPWEIERSDIRYKVNFGGKVEVINEGGRDFYKWINTEKVIGMAYDTPIIGYGGKTVNTLRLWSAKAVEDFNFQNFNQGDYTQAVRDKVLAENISQVLYPNDTQYMGKVLRLKQQYFFVACSLADIIARFKREGKDWSKLPEYAAVQLNDTHPSIAIAELMRILVDIENIRWRDAWEITKQTFAYTNHTLMPEALEKWSLPLMEEILPRHVQIIFEINKRFLQEAVSAFSAETQMDAIRKISIIEESNPKNIRMANLAIIGSHAVNGVAALHTKLLKEQMFPEFNEVYPEKFQNKTNGITPRRWLLSANPDLAALITETIGSGWITNADELKKLSAYASDSSFMYQFAKIKENNKKVAADWIKKDSGVTINPYSIFDTQVKRIHEYKRQMLFAFNIIMLYQRLKDDSAFRENFVPLSCLFGGKSAPGYVNAKESIKFINSIARVINHDATTRDLLQVHFLPNYRVSMAERLIPATNISEQISTAGLEASGTSNMKFMLNGALTIGTLDGANVEIQEEVGSENCFIFGHTEDEISQLRGHYNPWDYINANDGIKNAVNLVRSNYFNINEPDAFNNVLSDIFNHGDRYFVFADLDMYNNTKNTLLSMYKDNYDEFITKSILNVACSGHFSSDRTIRQYASDIWGTGSLIVPQTPKYDTTLEDAKNI